jgi:hypothetical protein
MFQGVYNGLVDGISAAQTMQYANNFVLFHGLPVWTVFSQSGENIRHGHNPRSHVQLAGIEMEWITRPIQLFVMKCGPFGNVPYPSDSVQNRIREIGVLPHYGEFVSGEFTRFIEYAAGYGHFSQVVQVARYFHKIDLNIGESYEPGNGGSCYGDSGGMSCRKGRSEINQIAEHFRYDDQIGYAQLRSSAWPVIQQ